MSRTFRNTNTVPAGWTVRDDGIPYHKDNPAPVYGEYEWPRCRYRRSYRRCERKAARKETYNSYRRQVSDFMRHGRYDDILPFCRTSGWNTW